MRVTERDKTLISGARILKQMLDHCPQCKRAFDENVALIALDGFLSDDQVAEIVVHLTEAHDRENHA